MSYRPITLSTVESYCNHRSYGTWLHEKVDGSGDYVLPCCRSKEGGLSGRQDNPKAVWLTTIELLTASSPNGRLSGWAKRSSNRSTNR